MLFDNEDECGGARRRESGAGMGGGEGGGREGGRGERRRGGTRSGSKDKRSTGYVTGGNGYARTALEAQCSVQLGSSGERCQRLLAKTKDD